MNKLAIFLIIVYAVLLIILFLVLRSMPRKSREAKGKLKVRRKGFFVRRQALNEAKLMENLNKEDQHWWREKERGELLGIFDSGGIKERSSYVDLLGKVVEKHEVRRQRQSVLKKAERAVFDKVEEVVRKMKQEEQKLENLTEKEAKNVFDRLREVVEKQQ